MDKSVMNTQSAQQVTEKILADAGAEADSIKEQADRKQSDQKAQLNQELARYRRQTKSLTQKAADDKIQHLLASARMDIAKQNLAEKRKILDEIFQHAEQQLRKLPDDQYGELVTKLLLQAVQSGDEQVIVDKNEKRINHDFIKKINRKLGPGYKGNLTLSDQKQDLGGGFILKRDRIKTNASFAVLIAQSRKDLEIELAKDLFA